MPGIEVQAAAFWVKVLHQRVAMQFRVLVSAGGVLINGRYHTTRPRASVTGFDSVLFNVGKGTSDGARVRLADRPA